MASDNSATVRAESGEPPAKRQKTFDYGPNAVLLRVDTTYFGHGRQEDLETIAVVSATRFHRATKGCFQASQASMTHNGTKVKDANMGVIVFTQEEESVIRVLAHWVHHGDIDEAVLKACVRDGSSEHHWIYLLFQVIEFWLRNQLDSSAHDQLVDCLTDWLKAEKTQGSDIRKAIRTAESAVEDLPSKRISDFKSGSSVIEILACLNLYHDRQSLRPCGQVERFEEKDIDPDINDQAYTYLLDRWEDNSKTPQDPLDDNFNQHCRYHLHGDKEVCYKKKQA